MGCFWFKKKSNTVVTEPLITVPTFIYVDKEQEVIYYHCIE